MNRKLLFSLTFIFMFLTSQVHSQQIIIKGKVIDKQTLQPLSFANIRVTGTTLGSSANSNGEYELKLNSGKYKLIASFIGYYTDTMLVSGIDNLSEINFELNQTKIDLPEILINPGLNPALEIIRKAIEKKKIRNQKLQRK